MLCLSGFELYSRWVPLIDQEQFYAYREPIILIGSWRISSCKRIHQEPMGPWFHKFISLFEFSLVCGAG